MTMSSVEPSVRFDPPLPFTSEQLGTGFITGSSRRWFSVKHELPHDVPVQSASLAILLPNGQSFSFRVSQEGACNQLRLDDNQSPQLDELLGLVRKDQHIRICQNQDVESSDRFTGFDTVEFRPCALPDLSTDDIDTSRTFLGCTFAAPILITGMTGGIQQGAEINRNLAHAASNMGIPMGVGSQRLALDNPEYEEIFRVKPFHPDVFLIGNIGLAQLNQGYDIDVCKRAIDMIQADALAIHLNVVQELVQVEGDRDFRHLVDKIHTIADGAEVPILVKEVGSGLDPESAGKLFEAGVAAVDIAGRGGTSWAYIEGLRSETRLTKRVADTFRNWGIPTAFALSATKLRYPDQEVVATGGIRNGLTVAKAVALGAQMAGVGLPLLKAAIAGAEEVHNVLNIFVKELQTAMVCTNCRTLDELKQHIGCGYPYEQDLPRMLEQNQL